MASPECIKLLLRLPSTNVNQQTISAIMYDNIVVGKGLTALGIAAIEDMQIVYKNF